MERAKRGSSLLFCGVRFRGKANEAWEMEEGGAWNGRSGQWTYLEMRYGADIVGKRRA